MPDCRESDHRQPIDAAAPLTAAQALLVWRKRFAPLLAGRHLEKGNPALPWGADPLGARIVGVPPHLLTADLLPDAPATAAYALTAAEALAVRRALAPYVVWDLDPAHPFGRCWKLGTSLNYMADQLVTEVRRVRLGDSVFVVQQPPEPAAPAPEAASTGRNPLWKRTGGKPTGGDVGPSVGDGAENRARSSAPLQSTPGHADDNGIDLRAAVQATASASPSPSHEMPSDDALTPAIVGAHCHAPSTDERPATPNPTHPNRPPTNAVQATESASPTPAHEWASDDALTPAIVGAHCHAPPTRERPAPPNPMHQNLPPTIAPSCKGSRYGVTHGLTSQQTVLRGESAADFAAYRAEVTAGYQPYDVQERDEVEKMVMCQWKLRRLWRQEPGIYAAWEDRLGHPDPDGAYAFLNDCQSGQALTRNQRHEAHLMRQFHRSQSKLYALQDQRNKKLRPVGAPVAGEATIDTGADRDPPLHGDSHGAGKTAPPDGVGARCCAPLTPEREATPEPMAATGPEAIPTPPSDWKDGRIRKITNLRRARTAGG
jgi:hypothetical protein